LEGALESYTGRKEEMRIVQRGRFSCLEEPKDSDNPAQHSEAVVPKQGKGLQPDSSQGSVTGYQREGACSGAKLVSLAEAISTGLTTVLSAALTASRGVRPSALRGIGSLITESIIPNSYIRSS
jgi:hypothetical protein